MKRLVLVLVAACALLAPAVASAHPLGNFTINKFARVEVSGHRLYVRYVVDMAEIPTLQRVPVSIGGLRVTVDGQPVSLHVTRTAIAHPRGAAGLHTTRFQAILAGPAVDGTVHVAVDDRNYSARIGWKEIVFGATTRSTSDELRAYPKDLLSSPLDVTRSSAQLAPTNDAPPVLLAARRSPRPTGSPTRGSHRSSRAATCRRSSSWARSRSRSSGAQRTHCRPGTARRSSPPTWSARAARRGTRRCSG